VAKQPKLPGNTREIADLFTTAEQGAVALGAAQKGKKDRK
jgi:hypothetical protein